MKILPWSKGQKEKPKKEDIEDVAKAVQTILESGYSSNRQVYKVNFIRGIVFGFGSVLGATVLVGLITWLLSYFDNMWFIGGLIDAVRDSLSNQ